MEQSVFVDAVKTLGIHNNVVRIELLQIQPDGKGRTELNLLIPITVAKQISEALQKVSKA